MHYEYSFQAKAKANRQLHYLIWQNPELEAWMII